MRRLLSLLLLAQFLWANALAASPALHHWLHGDDAQSPDHECVATLLATGATDSPVTPALLVARSTWDELRHLPPALILPPMDRSIRGTWENAPPL